MVDDSSPVPSELRDRAEAARAALGPAGVEWNQSSTAELSTDTSKVLSIASLPRTQQQVVNVLEGWNRQLGIDAEIHLIEQSAKPKPSAMTSTIRRLGRASAPATPDIVAAVRAVGWTVTAIDRIDVNIDGSSQRWVDLRASNVVAQAKRNRD